MKNEKIVKYNDIGSVLYRKNTRARNISIRISGAGEVKVTVPRFCTFQAAESFVFQKHSWIKKKLLSLERRNERKLVWDEGTILSMHGGRIYIEKGEADIIEVNQIGNDYQVFLSTGYDRENENDQNSLRQIIGNIGLKEAKIQFPDMLKRIAEKYELDFKRLTVRRMKSRWGSCTPENNISLNSALVFLSNSLIEYVMLHELVHTRHKNHGKDFWERLEQLMPDAKERRKMLNKHEIIF
ncbi:M48 family metallopeptidase [Bacteroidota bacterium]